MINMKIAIIYGSSTGTTENIAGKIASALGLGQESVFNVSAVSPEDLSPYDMLILGTSTWGIGELQGDWNDSIDRLKPAINGKTIALFGCGDSSSFGSSFCDGIQLLYEAFDGCRIIGEVDAGSYTFDASAAVSDGKFRGLAIDEVNESALTDSRIAEWVDILNKEM